MPLKTGSQASEDYNISKNIVTTLEVGETKSILIDKYKRVQKYLYEIGLKCTPKKEFSTKKVTDNQLIVTRII